jgi:hypothetical protein
MVLNVHPDALYLSAPHTRSRAGGYFFLGSTPCDGSPIQSIALLSRLHNSQTGGSLRG